MSSTGSAGPKAFQPGYSGISRRMSRAVLLVSALLGMPSSEAFSLQINHTFSRPSGFEHRLQQRESIASHLILSESKESSEPDSQNVPPKNLVDKATFVAATERLLAEVAKASSSNVATSSETSDLATPEEAVYAIGKLSVSLRIDTQPGLDFTESTGLVLVSGVSEETAEETGIQPLDTIVQVRAADGTFQESAKALNLEETIAILRAATNHALDNDKTEIELELNRLIQIRYAE